MEIRVELFLRFRDFAPAGSREGRGRLEVPEGATPADVLALLRIPPEARKVVLVDGRLQPPSTPLRGGQTLTVFPPLEGG